MAASDREFGLEKRFADDEAVLDDEVSKGSKNSLTKRRLIDDLLEKKRLDKSLKAFDYDFDDLDD